VVAEGTTLPATVLQDRSRAVWLIPTPEFQRARLEERGLPRGARELYLLLAETIEHEARKADAPICGVGSWRGIDATVADVERHFAAALTEGPVAESVTERRALLREANEAVVAQVRGYYARPWADGEPDEEVRTFLCECGDRRCDLTVEIPTGIAARTPVLAAGHG